MTRILITGASGRIGLVLAEQLSSSYELRLTDWRPPVKPPADPFVEADISHLDAARNLCHEIDIVLHMAADPNMGASWESLLPSNIIGLYNIFQAASEAGCRRVIYASSVNAVFGYPPDVQVQANMPARPINLYGTTKVWAEALASAFAHQTGLSSIGLRFGWVQAHDSPSIQPGHQYLDILLTYRDLVKLVRAAINAPDDLRYDVFHGVSNNRFKRLDISRARDILGYEPDDDAFALIQRVG